MHLLFVCTGNVCRSPTAERLTALFATAMPAGQLTASSAGTRALVGAPIEPTAAAVLRRFGGDDAGFSAQQLTAALVDSADLILTLTKAHRTAVLDLAPRAIRRTFTLLEAARLAPFGPDLITARARAPRARGSQLDIEDPIGRSEATFERVGSQIAEALHPVLLAVTGQARG